MYWLFWETPSVLEENIQKFLIIYLRALHNNMQHVNHRWHIPALADIKICLYNYAKGLCLRCIVASTPDIGLFIHCVEMDKCTDLSLRYFQFLTTSVWVEFAPSQGKSLLGIYLQKCLQLKLCDQAAKCICAQHCFETFLPMHLPYWRQKGQGRLKYCLDTAIIWIQQSSRRFSQTDQVSLRERCLLDQKCHRWDQKLGNLGSIHQMPYCKMVYRSIGSQGKQIKRITFKGRVERVERVCHVCVLVSLHHWHGTNLGSEQLLKICAPSWLTCPSRWDLTNCQPMSSEFPW